MWDSGVTDNNFVNNLLTLANLPCQQNYTIIIIKDIIFCHKYSVFPFLSSNFFSKFLLNLKMWSKCRFLKNKILGAFFLKKKKQVTLECGFWRKNQSLKIGSFPPKNILTAHSAPPCIHSVWIKLFYFK